MFNYCFPYKGVSCWFFIFTFFLYLVTETVEANYARHTCHFHIKVKSLDIGHKARRVHFLVKPLLLLFSGQTVFLGGDARDLQRGKQDSQVPPITNQVAKGPEGLLAETSASIGASPESQPQGSLWIEKGANGGRWDTLKHPLISPTCCQVGRAES